MDDEVELPVRSRTAEVEEISASTLPPLPVRKDRIKATPLATEGMEHASVSLFHDIIAK